MEVRRHHSHKAKPKRHADVDEDDDASPGGERRDPANRRLLFKINIDFIMKFHKFSYFFKNLQRLVFFMKNCDFHDFFDNILCFFGTKHHADVDEDGDASPGGKSRDPGNRRLRCVCR